MFHNNTDFGAVGTNAALEIANHIARRNDADLEADQPVDYAGLARLARNTKTVEIAQPAPMTARRATQPIIVPEPNM